MAKGVGSGTSAYFGSSRRQLLFVETRGGNGNGCFKFHGTSRRFNECDGALRLRYAGCVRCVRANHRKDVRVRIDCRIRRDRRIDDFSIGLQRVGCVIVVSAVGGSQSPAGSQRDATACGDFDLRRQPAFEVDKRRESVAVIVRLMESSSEDAHGLQICQPQQLIEVMRTGALDRVVLVSVRSVVALSRRRGDGVIPGTESCVEQRADPVPSSKRASM